MSKNPFCILNCEFGCTKNRVLSNEMPFDEFHTQGGLYRATVVNDSVGSLRDASHLLRRLELDNARPKRRLLLEILPLDCFTVHRDMHGERFGLFLPQCGHRDFCIKLVSMRRDVWDQSEMT